MTNHRPFKFRVWDTHQKQFIDFGVGSLRSDYTLNDIFEDNFNDGDRYTIQQFTGLTDKYGKDIYEGDILKFSLAFAFSGEYSDLVEVKWNNKSGRWIVPMVTIDYFNSSYVEIVGNIYENPELLKSCSKN